MSEDPQMERNSLSTSPSTDSDGPTCTPVRIPLATYRLQFNSGFTFLQAADLVPYLHALGVSHCYASPYLKARPGSMHGYDIIDHASLNAEIGTVEDFDHFSSELEKHGMGQILDIVPNHMGVMGSDNEWWLDVLENGQASAYAEFFDIDWEPPKQELRDKVLVPVLGDQYGKVLENGELKLVFDVERGQFSICYYNHRFPIDPKEYSQIIGYRIDELETRLGIEDPQLLVFQSLVTAFGHLPARNEASLEQRIERNRDKEIHKRRLTSLCKASAGIAAFIEENVRFINGNPEDAKSFELLHRLIKTQAFRLAYWRVAVDDINYRRFFDVNDLAALRMERDEVFAVTHRLVLDLVGKGKLDGLRIDHPDGLYDPLQYLQRLVSACRERHKEIYLAIEKITASYEHVPKHWPVHGTTGYRFANVVNGIFVKTTNADRMDRVYSGFIGQRFDYPELIYRSKRLIMKVSLASQLNVLANELSRIALSDRHTCDFTVNRLRDALMEVAACFPVYRTYVTRNQVSDDDKRFIDWAVSAARKKSRIEDASVFDFVRATLLTSIAEGKPVYYGDAVVNFAMRFQQFTSPVMAKAMEDTAFYIYHRLVSLNEVGGDPGTFGMTLNAFHGASQDRAKNWPATMLATSTHDGKRSEDVRARINVLSEMPSLWRMRLNRWSRLNRRKRVTIEGEDAPSRNDEYLLYQTLLGAWPLQPLNDAEQVAFAERIVSYILKAAREAKVHTSWLNPNVEYENALSAFVGRLLTPDAKNVFLADFLPFQKMIARFGMFNSLSQILIKFTSPGVPDIYQGNELWEFSLVDPDNRRQVDYRHRRVMLDELKSFMAMGEPMLRERVGTLLDTMEDSRLKLYVTWKTLEVRQSFDALYRAGDYLPLRVEGDHADHICAFARECKGQMVITTAPRFLYTLIEESVLQPVGIGIWGNTRIELPTSSPSRVWKNAFTGEIIHGEEEDGRWFISAASLFGSFPYALLIPAGC